MRKLIEFLVRKRHWFLFVLLEAVSLLLLYRGNRYQQTVMLSSANMLTGSVVSLSGSVASYLNLRDINKDLLERNGRLEARMLALQDQLEMLMADTVTYLLSLIMMADIQKPSANIIRSLLLLLFNYIEVSLDMAYFYYVYGEGSSGTGASLQEALAFGVLGQGADEAVTGAVPDMIMGYANTGLKFFFMTVVFGYLVQHMRQRKFRGERDAWCC